MGVNLLYNVENTKYGCFSLILIVYTQNTRNKIRNTWELSTHSEGLLMDSPLGGSQCPPFHLSDHRYLLAPITLPGVFK